MTFSFDPVAHIRSDFTEKFGIPRQSGLVGDLRAEVVFEPEFAVADAVRGLDEFTHLWLVWVFSENVGAQWHPTVRPPRLTGERRGVFATRSPLRPNPIGLSSVELIDIRHEPGLGSVLTIGGADLLDGTPILDIKPYLPADVHTDASPGYVARNANYRLDVDIPQGVAAQIPPAKLPALRGILAEDPRPQFHNDPERVYGIAFAGFNVRFRVEDGTARVLEISDQPH